MVLNDLEYRNQGVSLYYTDESTSKLSSEYTSIQACALYLLQLSGYLFEAHPFDAIEIWKKNHC